MIKIKNLTVRNFLSVGNVTQAITFDKAGLTLVLGNNLDLGGDGSRNGTGKTTIVNALSYALYGNALTNIRKDNLINKTNSKNMLVTLEFDCNGINYRIERGRKPNVLRFFVNDNIEVGETEEQQGENKETQEHIERVFDRFWRADPSRSRIRGGTGLGLSIVKHVAQNHGGEIKVWSVPGIGSTFSLRLPIISKVARTSK